MGYWWNNKNYRDPDKLLNTGSQVVPIFSPISHDFFYNIKYSLLKLVCTISRLCDGTPLQQLWLHCSWLTLPRVPNLTIDIFIFYRQDNIIRVNLHSPWSHFAFQPSYPSYILRTPSPSIYTLPRKAPCLCHAIPYRCAPLEENFHYVAWTISLLNHLFLH